MITNIIFLRSDSPITSDKPHYENLLPEGWTITTLGEIFQHNNGKQKSSSNKEGRLLKYITTSNVYWGEFDLSNVKEMFFTNNELEKCTVTKGDLLVCEGGDVGRSAIWNYEYPICIQNHLHRLRSWLPVCTEYFFYSLMYNKFKNLIKGKGIGLMSLSSNDLHNIPINLPPVNEQKRIVAEINRWFDLFKSIENNTDNLNTLIKTTKSKVLDLAIHGKLVPQDPTDEPATELLKRINPNAEITSDNGHYQKLPEGWCMTNIGSLFDAVSAKRVLKSEWKDKGVPFYRAREIVQLNKEGFADKDLFISEEHFSEIKDKYGIPAYGDIMISAVGSIGYTYIVKENDVFYYKDASVLCLKNTRHWNSKFFSIWLASPFLQEQMYKNSKGTTVDTITLEKLKGYVIPFPPLNEQHRIVAKVEEIFAQLDTIEASL